MRRFLLDRLEQWKRDPFRKPLVLNGARQVGKTWLLKEFGRLNYERVAYVSFDRHFSLMPYFESDFDFSRIRSGIQAATGVSVTPGDTLVILDEIQRCPAAIVRLKAWCEDHNEYHVVCAGSLVGLSLLPGTGWPVGKTTTLNVFPMSFGEYLHAIGEGMMWDSCVLSGDGRSLDAFGRSLENHLRDYMLVGGMPAAVEAFAATRSHAEARARQRDILRDYERDFSKHVPTALIPRVRAVWNAVPLQLAKPDRRFVAADVTVPGAAGKTRARDLRDPFEWLEAAGVVRRVWNATKPDIPLSAYRNHAFKLFGVDVGLLGAQAGLPVEAVLDGSRVFTEFKGALAEQFVEQELRAAGDEPGTWMPSDSQAEIDFLLQAGLSVVPIEVKAERSLRAKSLGIYRKRFSPTYAIRTSLSSFGFEDGLLDLPLPAIGAWRGYIPRTDAAPSEKPTSNEESNAVEPHQSQSRRARTAEVSADARPAH